MVKKRPSKTSGNSNVDSYSKTISTMKEPSNGMVFGQCLPS